MSKYDPLGAYLEAQPVTHVAMTFGEIEKVVGFSLPQVAHSARAWWSNNPSNNVMTKVWTAAGFKTEQVDMAARRLVFRRVVEVARGTSAPPASSKSSVGGKHPLFGCLKGTVTYAGDLDLTSPADPAWGSPRP